MPIHWAASGGHTDIVRFLLDLGVPVDNKDDVSFKFKSVLCKFKSVLWMQGTQNFLLS